MAEGAEKPAERRRWRVSPILTSAFALTILTAMFFLQGRAFRGGWLGYFGLEQSQFPISSSEAYWLTLHGWATTSVRWFTSAWGSYLEQLWRFGWLLFALCMLTFVFEWYKHHRSNKQSPNDGSAPTEPPAWIQEWLVSGNRWLHWLARAGAAIIITPLSLAIPSLLLFVVGTVLAVVIVLAIVPFENLGKDAAIKFCQRPISQGAKIVLRTPHQPEWGYRIECNPDVCAMIRDGRVFIIPTDSIERIELPPIEKPTQVKGEPEQQLCPTPGESATVPT